MGELEVGVFENVYCNLSVCEFFVNGGFFLFFKNEGGEWSINCEYDNVKRYLEFYWCIECFGMEN